MATIKSWSEEDRPREKLLAKGRESLSNAELIAILLGSGTPKKTAVDVAKELLGNASNDLDSLGRFSIPRLSQTDGIGPARAVTIVAALELGRRRKTEEKTALKKVGQSRDVWDYIYPHLADQDHEQFYILLLNRSHHIMRHVQVSKGGISGTVVDARLIFKIALEELATSLILCHNHPSGSKEPSEADKELTRKICEAGKLLDISVLDHLIFTNTSYFSFADEGLM